MTGKNLTRARSPLLAITSPTTPSFAHPRSPYIWDASNSDRDSLDALEPPSPHASAASRERSYLDPEAQHGVPFSRAASPIWDDDDNDEEDDDGDPDVEADPLFQTREDLFEGNIPLPDDAGPDDDDLPPAFSEDPRIRKAYYTAYLQATFHRATHEAVKLGLDSAYESLLSLQCQTGIEIEGLDKMARTLRTVERRLRINADPLRNLRPLYFQIASAQDWQTGCLHASAGRNLRPFSRSPRVLTLHPGTAVICAQGVNARLRIRARLPVWHTHALGQDGLVTRKVFVVKPTRCGSFPGVVFPFIIFPLLASSPSILAHLAL
ncbi:hypothetical protein FA95DRAFT_1609534 [Auriscalpium vulgare]|uniref:Uncharacterized protein n=1 Tax=Auriscalpium vulgare TaxID=40419 RepID=A0ACB8RH85_9AGAM|nr:hypothetical protein FA95DRAFT_1609534 [Auriscalpium vulgare]